MYNDYYLEQISNKLTTTNNNLQDIINNQEAILQNQQQLISGDIKIKEQVLENRNEIIGIELLIGILLIYSFVRGCFRC